MTPSDHVELVPDAEGGARLRFDEARASRFAKGVAGDFNPLHDPGDRRFCVPGDLLFAVLLQHYGLHRETSCAFSAMVGAEATLSLPPPRPAEGRAGGCAAGGPGRLHVTDERGREVLGFYAAGGRVGSERFVAALMLEYVRFSGRTFPEILMPLMRERGVTVNPDRPLIIYKDMAIRMDAGAGPAPDSVPVLEHGEHRLAVNGRKGAASLRFAIVDAVDGNRRLGEGEKNFVLGGLREHDDETVEGIVAEYMSRRAAWEREDAGGRA